MNNCRYDSINILHIMLSLKKCLIPCTFNIVLPRFSKRQKMTMHKKNILFNNLGKADITSHVNFALLDEFFSKNGLKVKNVVTQKQFLERMGILNRAEVLAKKMRFTDLCWLQLKEVITL